MSPSITSKELRASRGATARDTPGATKRARARQRPEKAIQRAILDLLETVPGVVAWKAGTGAFFKPYTDTAGRTRTHFIRMGKVGVSDIIGWESMCMVISCDAAVRGCREPNHLLARFLAIEVKRPGEVPSAQQAAFLASVKAAGGLALVAHSVDDVVSALGLAQRGSAAVAAP